MRGRGLRQCGAPAGVRFRRTDLRLGHVGRAEPIGAAELNYGKEISSTSKTSVAPAGITPGTPTSP